MSKSIDENEARPSLWDVFFFTRAIEWFSSELARVGSNRLAIRMQLLILKLGWSWFKLGVPFDLAREQALRWLGFVDARGLGRGNF